MEAPERTVKRARGLRRSMSLPEVLLWRELRPALLGEPRFRRQHPFGPYVLDFFCASASLAVEVDGESHGMGDRPAQDRRRDAWLAERGVRTLRVSARDVLEDPGMIAAWIADVARNPLSQLR